MRSVTWLTDATCDTFRAVNACMPRLAWEMDVGRLSVRVGSATLLIRIDVYERWRVTLTVPSGLPSDSTHYSFDAWYGSALTAVEAARAYLHDIYTSPSLGHPAHEAYALAEAACGVFES